MSSAFCFDVRFKSEITSACAYFGWKGKNTLTDNITTCNCKCLQFGANECQVPLLVNGYCSGHVVHKSLRSKKPCWVHMVTRSITNNAKESLDADTYIEALELTDFKGIRGNLMVGKECDCTKWRIVWSVAVTS